MSGSFHRKTQHAKTQAEGCVVLRASKVEFSSPTGASWGVAVDQIAILAEFTNEDGPWREDHFWVFVQHDGALCYAPMGAVGISEVKSELARALGFELARHPEDPSVTRVTLELR